LRLSVVLLSGVLLGLALASGPVARADEDPAARGQALARKYCAGCHRVAFEQAIPPPVLIETETGEEEFKAPSFWQAAHQENRDAAYFRSYIHAPRDPMPEEPLEPAELDSIIAYLMSLRGQTGNGW
jgi:mono/diheme cytochrome c family protein